MSSFSSSTNNKILDELNRNIEKLNISTEKANCRMIALTWAILILTAVLVFQEVIVKIISSLLE